MSTMTTWHPSQVRKRLQIDPHNSLTKSDFLGQLQDWKHLGEPKDVATTRGPQVDRFRDIYVRGLSSPLIRPALEEIILPPHDRPDLTYEYARKACLAINAQLSGSENQPQASRSWNRLWSPLQNRHSEWAEISTSAYEDVSLFSEDVWLKIIAMKDEILDDNPTDWGIDHLLRFTLGKFLFYRLILGFVRTQIYHIGRYEDLTDLMHSLAPEDFYEPIRREYQVLMTYAAADVQDVLTKSPEKIFSMVLDLSWLLWSLSWRWAYFRGHYLSFYEDSLTADQQERLQSAYLPFAMEADNNQERLLQIHADIETLVVQIGGTLQDFYEHSGLPYFVKLLKLFEQLQVHLEKQCTENPELVTQIIRSVQDRETYIPDGPINRLFGLRVPELVEYLETDENWADVRTQYGEETQIQYSGLAYHNIRTLVKHFGLTSEDVVYELGSGYGRIVLYLGATTLAKVKGVEIFKPRVKDAQRAQDRLKLSGVEIIEGDVAKQNLSDGTVFIIYNSFDPETLKSVMDNIRKVAENKAITVVSIGASTYYISTLTDWLQPKQMISHYEDTMYPTSDFFIFDSR